MYSSVAVSMMGQADSAEEQMQGDAGGRHTGSWLTVSF